MRRAERTRGFSLLEMLVAIAILSVSLGALYQAATGATRNVRTAERYAYGVELARSLLAQNAQVPASGVGDAGETDSGYRWEVNSVARPQLRGSRVRAQLHDLQVDISCLVDGELEEAAACRVMEQIERRFLSSALEQTNGNLTQAAKMLGVSYRSIRYKVKKLGVRSNPVTAEG